MAASSGIHPGSSGRVSQPRIDNIALALQEPITAIVRLRTNRQAVTDAASFRGHMRQLLQASEGKARAFGHSVEDIRIATFAVVAFLDESVLNLQNPVLADWPRKPLQEEMFGVHVAGEVFFDRLRRLMERPDSVELADLLEVFYLVMLLGFRGKYGVSGRGELHAIMQETSQRIRQIRGPLGPLAPDWAPSSADPAIARDPWMRRLTIITAITAALALLLFVSFRLSLAGKAADVEEMIVETRT